VDLGGGVVAEAIAIDIDGPRWRSDFEAVWPAGSDAHASYFDRILRGPDYTASDAVRRPA
jgi:hypothetical protein